MARANFVQTSFRMGEWSPFSQGRIDDDEYYAALNVCADFHPVDAGALVRRSGTQFVATIDALQGGTTAYVQLIPFDTDDGEHYVCTLTPGNMQFFNLGTFTLDGAAVDIESVSTADPALFTTSSAHGLVVGDRVTFTGDTTDDIIGSPSFLNVQLIVDTVPSTTTFTATYADARSGAVNASQFCFYKGKAGKIKELTLPYSVTELGANRVKYTQDSDFLFLFHPDHETQLVGETLALSQITLQDGPYFELNGTTSTLALSGTTGSVTVTASAVVGINGGLGFLSTDIGRHIRFQDAAGNWTWLTITAYTSTTIVTANINGADASAGTAVTTWRLGLYSDTTGWPTHGVLHELRLWLISDAQTSRIDGSKIIEYKETPDGVFSFEPTTADGTRADNNAVAALFNSQGRNRLNWISTDDTGLIAGSSDGVWVITASALDDPITPTSIQARRKSLFKSSDAQPALVNRSTVFVGDLEKEVIEIRRYEGGYDAKNVSRDGEHLTAEGLNEIYYANAPIPTLWGRTSNKRLIGASFRRDVDGEQTGWHQHNLEYALDATKTAAEGNVEAITVVKQSDKDGSNIDTLWMVNERNGFYCLEYMTPLFDQSRIDLEGFFVDGGMVYDQDNISTAWEMTDPSTNEYTFYGLWHLEGNTVDVVWRTLDMGQAVVTGGQVSIDIPEEALLADSSYYQASDDYYRIKTFTRSYATGFKNAVAATEYSATSLAPPPNGAQYLVGEDGETYMMMSQNANVDDIYLYDVNNDTNFLAITQASMFAVIKDNGMDPLGLMVITAGGTRNGCAFVVEGTKYLITMGQYSYTGGSPSAAYALIYWEVISPTEVNAVGGFVDTVTHTSTSQRPSDFSRMMAVGYLGRGEGANARSTSDILLAYRDNINEYTSIMRIPAIFGPPESAGDVLAFSPFGADSHGFTSFIEDRIVEISEWGANFSYQLFNTVQDGPAQNRGFFLPADLGAGIYFMSYVSKDICDLANAGTLSPAQTYITEKAADYPDGFLTGAQYVYSIEADFQRGSVISSQIMNCRFRDANDATAIPFVDEGVASDGIVKSVADSYANNPCIYQTDIDNWRAPWLIFWPKVYYNSDDVDTIGTFVKLAVYEWNMVTGRATELYTKESPTFNMNTELGISNVNNETCSTYVEWDRATGFITIIQQYLGGGIPASTYTTFADFDGIAIDVDTDLIQQQALSRGYDAVIGLNYASQGQLLRPQRGSNQGPDLGKTRRVDQFAMILHRTGAFKIGTAFGATDMESITPSEDVELTGKRPLFTGVYHGNVPDDYGFDGQIAWEMDRPGPGSFLAVGGFRNTQDR